MVRRNNERDFTVKEARFGGDGVLYSTPLIKGNEELLNKGRLLAHNILMPGCSLGEHTHHGDMEIYYILSGQGEYDDNGVMTVVQSGDVCFCHDGQTHSLKNVGQTALEFIALVLFEE